MADPVQKPDTSLTPASKASPAAPKVTPAAKGQAAAPKVQSQAAAPKVQSQAAAPKVQSQAAKPGQPKPQGAASKPGGKPRMEPLNVNLGRTGLPQESALPVKKAAPAAKPAPGAKPAPAAAKPAAAAAKPAAGAKPAPGAKPAAPAAPAAKPVVAAPKPAPVAGQAEAKKREKDHYFILENLCVGCGLCLDKCPPKVQAIGYKFYGDVQEGGFRAYIDQNACISCSSCFNSGECPASALVEVHPDGEVLDYPFTPPDRLDFDLRFLHRFHREAQ